MAAGHKILNFLWKVPIRGSQCVCGKVAYCGRDCQRTDWSRHKAACTSFVIRQVFMFFTSTLKPRESKWPHKKGLLCTFYFKGCYVYVGSMLG
jgi:hypothetical protein